jgi:hypothetical protein
MPEEKPERATPEMKEVINTFLKAGYSAFTDGYEESFADFVDNIMQRNPERANIYRNGSQGLLEAGETVLEELGISKKEYEQKYDMIRHIGHRARLG